MCTIDQRIRLEGGPRNCDIIIDNVVPKDYGDWDCMVNEIVHVSSDQERIALEVCILFDYFVHWRGLNICNMCESTLVLLFQVGQPAVVEFTGGYKNNELKITEGDTAKVSSFLLFRKVIPKTEFFGVITCFSFIYISLGIGLSLPFLYT